ncbi:alpha/beta hydrolase [Amycolatopsis carbonis]|uniref:Alpha/beta hydrolase n=1 Tax=Amycolatopsis carbonis TaxID=715471 RepID=A0A9Y2IQ99_9PSEU|nr:alpha/beta hydrolase [Amycolatopsis sp. 2-15]WIX83196.1 alpha/beta hydrolase [Amycolatopsis sp. 2-15]
MSSDPTVVLAHGAWADGSSWSKVIDQLEQTGVRVLAASLPLTTLAGDTEALDRALEHVGGPVVLVGHAYAGGVLGGVTAPNVKALVYVAALAPDEGETVGDVFGRGTPHPQAPALAPDSHGLIWLPDEAFAAAFAPNATAEEQVRLRALQRPISGACITVPVNRPRWRGVPSWYLVTEQDRMIPAENQRFMAERMGAEIRVHDVDHTPSVTAPGVVSDLLREVVAKVKANQA